MRSFSFALFLACSPSLSLSLSRTVRQISVHRARTRHATKFNMVFHVPSDLFQHTTDSQKYSNAQSKCSFACVLISQRSTFDFSPYAMAFEQPQHDTSMNHIFIASFTKIRWFLSKWCVPYCQTLILIVTHTAALISRLWVVFFDLQKEK